MAPPGPVHGRAKRAGSGGNPGTYQQLDYATNTAADPADNAAIYVVHAFAGTGVDPGLDGAIASIDYFSDVLPISGSSAATFSGPALMQDGKAYVSAGLLELTEPVRSSIACHEASPSTSREATECRSGRFCSPTTDGGAVTWSGRGDSNSRPPEPHSGALPSCATARRGERVSPGGRGCRAAPGGRRRPRPGTLGVRSQAVRGCRPVDPRRPKRPAPRAMRRPCGLPGGVGADRARRDDTGRGAERNGTCGGG